MCVYSIRVHTSGSCDATSSPPTSVTSAEASCWICRQNLPRWLFAGGCKWRTLLLPVFRDSWTVFWIINQAQLLNGSSYLHSGGCRFAMKWSIKKRTSSSFLQSADKTLFLSYLHKFPTAEAEQWLCGSGPACFSVVAVRQRNLWTPHNNLYTYFQPLLLLQDAQCSVFKAKARHQMLCVQYERQESGDAAAGNVTAALQHDWCSKWLMGESMLLRRTPGFNSPELA